MLKKIAEYEEESSCANVKMKSERRVLIKLRGGTAPFQMETGRWHGLKREERVRQWRGGRCGPLADQVPSLDWTS